MSNPSAANLEIEIKVRITDRATFAARLPELGFHLQTPETMERNMLFDTVDNSLRERKELLRIRRYGTEWLLTHKAEDPNLSSSLHKTRIETETKVDDGESLAGIFQRLGFAPVFTYEKYRTEWADGKGHIVVDVTPIGDFAELEGDSTWIDETAAGLKIQRSEYITTSYGQLFRDWKNATGHPAMNMTFAEIGTGK